MVALPCRVEVPPPRVSELIARLVQEVTHVHTAGYGYSTTFSAARFNLSPACSHLRLLEPEETSGRHLDQSVNVSSPVRRGPLLTEGFLKAPLLRALPSQPLLAVLMHALEEGTNRKAGNRQGRDLFASVANTRAMPNIVGLYRYVIITRESAIQASCINKKHCGI